MGMKDVNLLNKVSPSFVLFTVSSYTILICIFDQIKFYD